MCDSGLGIVYEREDLYHQGWKAYKSDDYVTALEDLFAFKELNEKQFQTTSSENMKSFQNALFASIAYAENKLRSQRYSVKPGIEKYDNVVKVFNKAGNGR